MAVREGSSRRAGSSYVLSVAVLLVVAILSVSAVISYSVSTAAAEHLLAVRQEASQWLGTLLDAETGVRGYLATDKSMFLEPYLSAVGQERARAAAIQALVVGDHPGVDQMQTAERDAEAVMNHLAMLTDLARSGRREEALRQLETGKGKVLMDTFRRDLVALDAIESELNADQKGKASLSIRSALFGTIALSLLSGGVILVAWRRERAQQILVETLGNEARRRLQALSDLASALAGARSRAEVIKVVIEHGTRAAGRRHLHALRLERRRERPRARR